MKPIHNFRDHPHLKDRSPQTIYFLDNGFYLANSCELVKIVLRSLSLDNIGEPYRELVRVNFAILPSWRQDFIDISPEDGIRLLLDHKERGIYLETSSDWQEIENFDELMARF